MRLYFFTSISVVFLICFLARDLKGQQPQVQSRNYEGSVKTIGRDFVVVKTADAEVVAQVNIAGAIDNGTSTMISVRGIDGPSFLRRGMMLEFDCRVSKTGKVIDPVKEISVFTPLEFTRTGINFLEEQSDEENDAEKVNPDSKTQADSKTKADSKTTADSQLQADSVTSADPKIGEEESTTKSDKKKSKKNKSTRRPIKTRAAHVTGRISNVAKRKFTVEIVGGSGVTYLNVPVFEKTIVKYEVSDPTLVQVGDPITLTASEIRFPRVLATSIVVTRETPKEIQDIINANAVVLNPPDGESAEEDTVASPATESNQQQVKVNRLAAWSSWRPKRQEFQPLENEVTESQASTKQVDDPPKPKKPFHKIN